MRRALLIAGGVIAVGLAAAPTLLPFGLRLAAKSLPPLSLPDATNVSPLVLARDGGLLRPFTTKDGKWRLPVDLGFVDRRFLSLLLAYEDHRFYAHQGVDLGALLRAGTQWIWRGHIVSGGSTITMQLARLLEPRGERSLGAKFRQMMRAAELEARLSKDDILRLYLTLAPYGGNLEGVRAASLAYFGKEPARLSIGETALLVALPQSPETRRPDLAPIAARHARDLVLRRLRTLNMVSAADLAAASDEALPAIRRAAPFHAPHLAERLVARTPDRAIITTTIDLSLQTKLEAMLAERMPGLGAKLSAALLVVDNHSGDVLADIGSAGYLDRGRAGAVDMTNALRSPGSTLKPFIYAFAFDAGLAHPETLVSDEPQHYGAYAPANFDRGHQGTLSLRKALQFSLNLPAIELLEQVTPARFLSGLRAAGTNPVLPRGSVPGLAVGLGGLGMTLSDLTSLYVGLARDGVNLALRFTPNDPLIETRLTGAVAAWYVADILRQAPPPDGMAGSRFAFKTGTSYGFRDAWAVGFTRDFTVAVWVGRPDNGAVSGLTGRTAAAPLLFEAFARLGRIGEPPEEPKGAVIAANSALPPPLRAFGQAAHRFRAAQDGVLGEAPLKLAFPPDGARIEREPGEPILLKAAGGAAPLQWFVDGVPIVGDELRRSAEWQPRGPGFARITVNDRNGAVASARVRLD